MTESQKPCPLCLKPKVSKSGGFVTQFLGVCRCDQQPAYEDQGVSLKLCSSCGKSIEEGRSGSLTQWIFRFDRCSCASPVPLGSGRKPLPVPRTIVEGKEEAELEMTATTFPVTRYKAIAQLGAGGSGTVYLARDRMLGKKVAVKILHQLSSAQIVAFQDEARVTSKLTHKGIIQILDFGPTDEGLPYMVLEYLENAQSLEQYLNENESMPLPAALFVFSNMCEALAYANEQSIFHRDIKPSNVLIADPHSNNIKTKLIDFGVALVKKETLEPTMFDGATIIGTPTYMAPELVRADRYDARSEVYSIGCMLFEALTGVPPFQGATSLETLKMHVNTPAPSLSSVAGENFPREMEALVAKCLAKRKEDRYRNPWAVMKKLDALQAGTPDSLFNLERVDVTAKRTPWSRYALSALAVVALASFTVPALIPKKEQPAKGKQETKAKASPKTKSVESDFETPRISPEWMDDRITIKDAKLEKIEKSDCAELEIINSHIERPDALASVGILRLLQVVRIVDSTGCTPSAMSYLAEGLKEKARKDKVNGVYLDFSGSDIDDSGLAELTGLTKVRALFLSNTKITDKGFASLSKMKKLRALDVSNTAINDQGLAEIAKMPILILLRANDCPNLSKDALSKLDNRIALVTEKIEAGPNLEFSLNELAAKKGNVEAQFELGTRYHTGRGIEVNFSQAIYWYTRAAGAGNILAANNLGTLYMHGQGTPVDGKSAFKWFSMGAAQGEPNAMNNIGLLYMQGMGVPKDYEVASGWFKKAAAKNFAEAQNNLGILYNNGFGVKADPKLAAEWFKKSADQEFAEAEFNLGICYLLGKGVPQDTKRAFVLCHRASGRGLAKAQFAVGSMYQSGSGARKDEGRAFYFFQLAADQNFPDAEFTVGQCYEVGAGVEKNYDAAMKWYRRAWSHKSPQGAAHIGYLYEHGLGVPVDYGLAMKWYKKAADMNHSPAQAHIGHLYDKGLGVEANKAEARKWMELAAKNGNKGARKELLQGL